MTSPLIAFLIKLPLALLVFLLVAYAGTVSKRVAGVLFTFPILNGIAIIASPDPVTVADAIYPLVIFNCVLFAIVISFAHSLPRVDALPRRSRLLVRVIVWAAAWLVGAYLITDVRQQIFGAAVLFVGALIVAFAFMHLCWSQTSDTPRVPDGGGVTYHSRGFASFWLNSTGLWRIVLFALAYGCLVFVSRAALDEKWVGMASALPLPGLFALAALIDDSDAAERTQLLPMRDTVFLGPLLVIPFNWAFSHILAAYLPPDLVLARYLLLFAMWAVAALAVLRLVPRLSTTLDRLVSPASPTR
jgi:hypothetical protein